MTCVCVCAFPQAVCPHYGVGLGVVSFASGTAAFDCAGLHRVPFATTVPHGSLAADFWVVLPGVRARFEAKRGFT